MKTLCRKLYITMIIGLIMSTFIKAQDTTSFIIICPECTSAFQKLLPSKPVRFHEANTFVPDFLHDLRMAGFFEVTIDTLFTDNEITELKVHPGNPYIWEVLNINELPSNQVKSTKKILYQPSIKEVQVITEEILAQSENTGYPFAALAFEDVEIKKNRIYASLKYHSGPFITFDSLQIDAHNKISVRFLTAFLNIEPGAAYNQQLVNQIDKKLTGLPYLQLNNKSVSFQNQEARVYLELEPLNANHFEGVLGLAPNPAMGNGVLLTGQIDFLLQNLFRSGKVLGFEWRRIKPESQSLDIIYKHPRLFSTPLNGAFNLDLLKQDSSFLNRNINFSLGLDLNSQSSLYFMTEYRYSNAISETSIPDFRWLAYGGEYQWNNFDHIYFPKRGRSFQIKSLIGNKSLIDEGNKKVVQFMASAQFEHHLWLRKNLILYQRIAANYIGSKNIYQNDLYQIGGLNDLRGFNENEFFVKEYLLINNELRYFFEEKSYFFLLYDQAFLNKWASDPILPYNYPSGIGTGLAMRVNNGLLKLVYAVGAQKNQSFDFGFSKIHFGFETVF